MGIKVFSIKAITPGITVLLLILAISWAQVPGHSTYSIDSSRSRIELTVLRTGILKAIGHDHVVAAKSFSGGIRVDSLNMEESSVNLSIESASLVVLDDPSLSENDRKQVQANMEGTKVLDTQQFPRILFHSTSVSRGGKPGEDFTIAGKLNLHGLEKEISFPVRVSLEKDRLRVTGTAVITQTDFGIKPIKGAAGGLRVKDPVKINFDILAARAD